MATLAEMYVQGVSTRKVKAIPEELCGHAFSASAHLRHQQTPGREPRSLRRAPLAEPFAYLIFDAHYEKVREAGVVMSQAVLIAIGIDWDGRRQILAVEMASREKPLILEGLPARTAPARPQRRRIRGRRRSRRPSRSRPGRCFAEAAFQRCYIHFLRNALDHLPRKADDDRLQEFSAGSGRSAFDRGGPPGPAASIAKWGFRYPKLVGWVEETIEETLTFYRLPRQHHKHLKSDQYARTPQRGNQTPNPLSCKNLLPNAIGMPTPRPRPSSSRPTKTGSKPTAISTS